MPSSRGSSYPRDRTQVSCTAGRFFAILATRKAQEYSYGLPCPPPGDLPNPRIELRVSCIAGRFFKLSRVAGWIVVPFPMIGNTVRETDLREQAMRGARVWCGQIKVNVPLGHSSRYVGPFMYSTNNFLKLHLLIT